MAEFKTHLVVELMTDTNGIPLSSRFGDPLYRLKEDLIYQTDVWNATVTVPAGFITDFASVPRIPIIYDFVGNQAQEPATIHDYLYITAPVVQWKADKLFLEAMLVTKLSKWKAYTLYFGVRTASLLHLNHYGS